MSPERLLLITLLLNLGVMAAIAAVVVRSMAFRRYLYLETRDLRQKLMLALFLVFPLVAGVFIRILVPNFRAADLSLQGTLLMGLMGGYTAGFATAGALGLAAAFGAQQWAALPVLLVAAWVGGVLRRSAPSLEEVWAFSPFIDLELWRWLRNRLDRPFRDWQALVFATVTAVTLLQIEVKRLAPARIYAPEPHTFWIVVAIVATNVLALAIPIKIWNNTRIEMLLEQQQRLLVQARLDELTSQINPHFLFNTLNSVASLVRFDPDTARVLIVKLSNILRRMLRKHDSHVPLREELAFIDDYLDIEVVRFGPEKLRVERDIAPAAMEIAVPSMALQPVIENSIRHGLGPKVEGGRISLRAWVEPAVNGTGPMLWLEVEDDGVGITPGEAGASGHGIGLSNIRERLRVFYGEAGKLEISSVPGQGTRVRIALPV
ncbi:MAG TPA: histidine kinase [Terriglobales bacterium]|nr:histidine kinase [Terriglobales bacterium]